MDAAVSLSESLLYHVTRWANATAADGRTRKKCGKQCERERVSSFSEEVTAETAGPKSNAPGSAEQGEVVEGIKSSTQDR